MIKFRFHIMISILLLGLFLVACSSDENVNSNDPVNNDNAEPEPITLKFLHDHGLDEEGFKEQYTDPIENEFSHITIEHIASSDLSELIAHGEIPDLYFVENPANLDEFIESELVMDLSDLIEKHGFDLDRIEPNLIAEHRTFSEGNLYTLPLSLGLTALHYNKDIFDAFGVDYPTDNMTWDEVISLAEKVTGEIDGVQYHGLQPAYPTILLDQREVVFVDPDTDESTLMDEHHDDFLKVLQAIEGLASIPGNIPDENSDEFLYGWGDEFISQRNIAMLPLWQLIDWYSSDESFDFDIVTYPEWEDFPGVTRPSRAFSVGITPTSEHKDDAFKVLAFLLSDEKQIEWAEGSQASPLKDPEINQHLFTNLITERPYLEEVNLDALTKQVPSPGGDRYSPYEDTAQEIFQSMVRDLIEEKKDVNTVIREGHEKVNIAVEEEKTRKE